MKFIIFDIFALAFLATVYASNLEKSQLDSKQEKRSLSHDEWSTAGVLQNAPILPPEASPTIGVSTHTDTLTTVREKIPVPSPYPVLV
jgi:hypothetical protein